jgi:hypothetical protein
MRRDMLRAVAAYLDPRRSLRTGASGWIERLKRQYKELGFSPVYAAGARRGCAVTQISLSSGRILVMRTEGRLAPWLR